MLRRSAFALRARGALVALLLGAPGLALAQRSTPPPGFVETTSGCVHDGGLCLVPPAHQSEPVEVVRYLDGQQIWLHDDLVYGTGHAELVAPGGRVLLSVSDSLLHGHEWFAPAPPAPYFPYRGGLFRDHNRRLRKLCLAAGAEPEACQLRLSYRHATSDVRWERQSWSERGAPALVDTLDVSWWGVVPSPLGGEAYAERDYQPLLAHILNVAQLRRASVVLFPECGDYGYYGPLAFPEVTLVGVGGTEMVTAQDDLGHTYRPVRIVDCPTRLRALPGTAARHLRTALGPRDARYLPPDPKAALHAEPTAFYVQSGVMRAGLKNIVLDGNWRGQAADLEALKRDERGRELFEVFRNSPAHAGFVAANHSNVEVPKGQHLTLENVAIVGYSTSTLGHVNNTWTMRNVRLADAPLNHLVYCADGDWTNVTLAGFSWHAGPTCPKTGPDGQPITTTIRNLVLEDGAPNRFRQPFDGVIDFRGSTVFIDGFYLDLRGSGYRRPFSGRAGRLWVRDGVVIFDKVGAPALYAGNSEGLFFDDVDIVLNEGVEYLVGIGKKKIVGFRDVRVRALPGTSASLLGVLAARSSGRGPLVFVENVDLGVPLREGFGNVHEKRAQPRLRLCADGSVRDVVSTLPPARCDELRTAFVQALSSSTTSVPPGR